MAIQGLADFLAEAIKLVKTPCATNTAAPVAITIVASSYITTLAVEVTFAIAAAAMSVAITAAIATMATATVKYAP